MASPPPVLLLHGFTQTAISWRPVLEALPGGLEVRAIDLPGHGHGGPPLDLSASAERVAAAIGAAAGPTAAAPALVVGYSMGGRVALRLALDHPDVVAGLVLLGATAGIDDPAERAVRRDADEALARSIEAEGVPAFLERWVAQPLFAGLALAEDDRDARLANTPAGLAGSLRRSGTGTMDPPWWDDLEAIDAPTLVAWGERDEKFAALGARLAAAIGPNARTLSIPGAGHAAHLGSPDAFAAAIVEARRQLI